MEPVVGISGFGNAGKHMRLIATGPPKSGTSALKAIVIKSGFNPLPGGLIFDEWKRHEEWVEDAKFVTKDIVKENIVTMLPEEAYAALRDGRSLHGHIAPPVPPDIPVLVIVRDPRAAMVSWFRAKEQGKFGFIWKYPDQSAVRRFRKFMKHRGVRAAAYIRPIYDGWLSEPPRDNLLIVRYEKLFTKETLQLISSFTGGPLVRKKDVYGIGSKFTGFPNDSQGWYDEEVDDRFKYCWEQAGAKSISGKGRAKDRLDNLPSYLKRLDRQET